MLNAAIPLLPTSLAAASANGQSSAGTTIEFVVVLLGLCLVGQAVVAYWQGQRFRFRATSISSIRAGRVVVSGIAEPAWAVVTSHFWREACVWCHSKAWIPEGKYAETIFNELNAVPFVLNDGTGRALVLGRSAKWDPATTWLDRELLADDEIARAEGASHKEVLKTLDRPLGAAPSPLKAFVSDKYTRALPGSHSSEDRVRVGERVTVTGRAFTTGASTITDLDGCPDDGRSLGLTGYIIGPDKFLGMSVLAGNPHDAGTRGRMRMLLGLVGLLAIIAGIVLRG
jgi:hypothetical protein